MLDPSANHAPNVKELIDLVNEAAEKIGRYAQSAREDPQLRPMRSVSERFADRCVRRPINVAPKFKEMMETAGFVDIEHQVLQVSSKSSEPYSESLPKDNLRFRSERGRKARNGKV